MVDYISLEKSFYPRMIGDFTGANIDIVSKEYTGKAYVKIGVGSSVNLQTIDNNKFKLKKKLKQSTENKEANKL